MKGFCAFLLMMLWGIQSFGCECIFNPRETLKERVEKYSVIFYAEVLSLEDRKNPVFNQIADQERDSLYFQKYGYEPKLQILDVLKGDISKEITDQILIFQSDFSMCSMAFSPEKKYLIFASRDENGILRTSTCAPNQIFNDDEAFLKQKNEILKAM